MLFLHRSNFFLYTFSHIWELRVGRIKDWIGPWPGYNKVIFCSLRVFTLTDFPLGEFFQVQTCAVYRRHSFRRLFSLRKSEQFLLFCCEKIRFARKNSPSGKPTSLFTLTYSKLRNYISIESTDDSVPKM